MAIKEKFPHLSDGSVDLSAWLAKIKSAYSANQFAIIEKACQLAETTSKGLTTFYGQPCIEQSLEMAGIILELKLDYEAVTAAVLVSTLQHTSLALDAIKASFGDTITQLISGVSQMNNIHNLANIQSREQIQIDRLRKTLLAMVSDIRVVIIKLAERTSIMRGIKNINPTERKRIAQEAMDVYAPLANRLGIGQLKWELEDYAFHYIDPEAYKSIAAYIAERRTDREQRINGIITELKTELKKSNVIADLSGRPKHIYSVYLKMRRKDSSLQAIYDYTALRILVPSIPDCYTALAAVHQLWESITEEFDDYISHPKPNGYRSIHTAVIGPDGKNMEIQIRTRDMHDEAEHGVAAHWIYKENPADIQGHESKITFLRQLLAWHKDVAKEDTAAEKINQQIMEDRVYVFTPAGAILDLPQGATPLDFAYQIHSELGNRCRGAKANGHIVPLTYTLGMGDKVEIITAPHGAPSRDWIRKDTGYLKTARARAKVAQWFRHQETLQHADAEKITHVRAEQPVSSPSFISHKKKISTATVLPITGADHFLTRIARCCKPIPGDPIIGYITQGRGVSIHRQQCPNISHLSPEHQSRFLEVSWGEKQTGAFLAELQVRAYGHENILRELSSLFSTLKVDLLSLNSNLNQNTNILFVTLTVQIKDKMQMQQLVTEMGKLPNVLEVKRIAK